MGEELRKVSMKWSPDTVEAEAELLNAFSGLVEGRSHMSRIAYKIARAAVRTMGIVRVIEEFVQDKQGPISCDQIALKFPSASITPQQLGPKPPVRANHAPGRSHGRREFGGVSRRSVASVAWGASFHIHFTPVNERAA